MIHYRPATVKDLSYLRDLDLKCHEQIPSSHRWWAKIEQNLESGCYIGCKSHVPIAMAVWERKSFRLPDFERVHITLHLHKLCVRKEFRNKHIGRRLIAHAHEEAKRLQCGYLSISVPEYMCGEKAEHGNVAAWLNQLGFKATIILPTKVHMYGQSFDQFLFIYKVQ